MVFLSVQKRDFLRFENISPDFFPVYFFGIAIAVAVVVSVFVSVFVSIAVAVCVFGTQTVDDNCQIF